MNEFNPSTVRQITRRGEERHEKTNRLLKTFQYGTSTYPRPLKRRSGKKRSKEGKSVEKNSDLDPLSKNDTTLSFRPAGEKCGGRVEHTKGEIQTFPFWGKDLFRPLKQKRVGGRVLLPPPQATFICDLSILVQEKQTTRKKKKLSI